MILKIMQKVLMLGWELPPFNSGGLGVACFFMAEALSKKTDLIFALPKKIPISNTPFKVIFADEEMKIMRGYSDGNDGFSEMFNEVESYGQRLLKVIRQKGLTFDLIHSHDWLSASAATYLKEKLNVPAIVHIHSTEIERTGGNPNLLIYNKEKENFNKVNHLIAVSHQTREIVYQNYNIPRYKISVVPNGIEFEEHNSKQSGYLQKLKLNGYKLVLFVGRFAFQKGPDYLLETLPIVKNFVKVKYIFCGSGEMMEKLVRRASNLGILQDVIFTGFLRNEELWGIYKIADLLVAPSVFEPFGLVPLEGVKYKTPVIISKTTGVGDYLVNVLKTDFWDVNKMADLIISTLKYPNIRNEMIDNAYRELPKFNWEARTDKIMSIYKNLI